VSNADGITTCPTCGGGGNLIGSFGATSSSSTCPTCHGTGKQAATPTDAGEAFRADPPAVCLGCSNAFGYCYEGIVSSWVFYAAKMGECPVRQEAS
jgi:RecJ-like exonuclease